MSPSLEELREELKCYRESTLTKDLGTQVEGSIGTFQAAWPGMLLAHRFNGVLATPRDDIRRGTLTLTAPTGSKEGRERIGTDRCVFCTVGAAPYWDPPFVLLFGPLDVFTDHRLVTPWDTRGAVASGNYLGLSEAELVARYSLSHPEDAGYLPELLATCFADLDRFLGGEPPLRVDPAGVWHRLVNKRPKEDLRPLHTPEARFNADVQLGPGSLHAVLVDVDKIRQEQRATFLAIQRIVEKADGRFVKLRGADGAVDYQAAAMGCIRHWLTEGGWIL